MSFSMSLRTITCVRRTGAVLQRRLFTPRTVPRAPRAPPFLPHLGILQSCSFGSSRLFSSAGKLFEKAGNGWNDGDVPDVKKWNERMDELAVQSKTDLAVIGEWADLLEEGVAARLPDIEITLRRHRDISSNLEEYMDAVIAESEDSLDEELDDEDELTDEELARIIEEEEEEEEAGEGLGTEDEHILEDVAREELANELEREQGSDEKGNKGRKF